VDALQRGARNGDRSGMAEPERERPSGLKGSGTRADISRVDPVPRRQAGIMNRFPCTGGLRSFTPIRLSDCFVQWSMRDDAATPVLAREVGA